MVLLYEKKIVFAFFTIHFTHVAFPQSSNNKSKQYIAIWTSKHYIQQWMFCNVVPTIKTNGHSIFVNQIMSPFNYLFERIHLGLLNKYVHNPWYDGGL